MNASPLAPLAQQLGVDVEVLNRLGIQREGNLWTIPERDADGQIIGYATRTDAGQKGFKKGGSRGLTVAWPLEAYAGTSPTDPILVVEGMSDTAIGMQLEFTTVGRPSALLTKYLPELSQGRRVVVISENDGAGQIGATKVADDLINHAITVQIVYPPLGIKDLRDWVAQGCNRESLLVAIDAVDLYKKQDSLCVEVRQLPDDMPSVLPFESYMLPDPVRPFVDDIADRLQCPPDFPAMATLVVMGSVIGRRCGIRPRRKDDWTVVPNLWGGVVGRPSQMKTPAIKVPLLLLQRLEVKAHQYFEADELEYEKEDMLSKAMKSDIEKKLKVAISKGENTAPILTMLDDCRSDAPVRERFITNDATVEKLGEILRDNLAGVMVFRDELMGLLYSLEKDNQQGARAFYLEAWDGTGRFTYDRIGRGTVEIESATVSVFGGIQPGRLEPYVRRAVDGGMDNDGFMQRFQLLVWPNSLRYN